MTRREFGAAFAGLGALAVARSPARAAAYTGVVRCKDRTVIEIVEDHVINTPPNVHAESLLTFRVHGADTEITDDAGVARNAEPFALPDHSFYHVAQPPVVQRYYKAAHELILHLRGARGGD